MIRYEGQSLPEGCRIAVIANDALGNFVIATPLLQMLRRAWKPVAIDFYGGSRTEELQLSSELIDAPYSLHGKPFSESLPYLLERAGTYALVVNLESTPFAKCVAAILGEGDTFVCGPCMGKGGRGELETQDDDRGRLQIDPDWMGDDIMDRYPFLESPWIGEIFCRLAYLAGPVPKYQLPSVVPDGPIPELLISTAASGADKLWPMWEEFLHAARRRKLTAGLLGAKPSAQRAFWKGEGVEEHLVEAELVIDLRGHFTLPEVVGAIAAARAVVTIDNGILHLASSTATPTVGLFRWGIHRLWAPPSDHLKVLTPGPGRNVSEIPLSQVLQALDESLNARL